MDLFFKPDDLFGPWIARKGETRFLKSSSDAFNATLFAYDHMVNRRTVFVVVPNLYDAQNMYDLLSRITDAENLLFYPADQTLTAMMALGSPEFKSERLYTLKQLMTGNPYIVVTTPHGFGHRQLTPHDYENGVRIVRQGAHYDLDDLVGFLVNSGYQRTYTVEKPGEFALRGHILDVFTLNNDQPYRLDFFDVELERIKVFDVETQRSTVEVERLEIAPMHELFYTDAMKEKALKAIDDHFSTRPLSDREKEKLATDLEHLRSRSKLDTLSVYIPFFNPKSTTISDFAEDHVVYMTDPHKMKINEETSESDLLTYAQTMDGDAFIKIPFRLSLDDLLKRPHTAIDTLGLNSPESATDMKVRSVSHYQGNLELMALDIKSDIMTKSVLFVLQSEARQHELEAFLTSKGIPFTNGDADGTGVCVTKGTVAGSFDAYGAKQIVIDEGHLFKSRTRAAIKYRSVLNQAKKIRKADDLVVGDFVVHYDYGIGRYVGLKTMDLSGDKRDYLHIVYAGDEALYVPVDQIHLVLKYSSDTMEHPKLSKMGGKQWAKTKAAVRMRIKDLSDRLIRLYAARQQSVGHAFDKENPMLDQFERDFPYEPTIDQLKTIHHVYGDMRDRKPMDRLVCGDVGFGKTEVAMRAAFKAVLENKQVLYLCPTTVLARQHYYTFKERFEKYGANIALMSRFVTPKQQRETLEKLKKGYVDVVIGTHRMLSEDIRFKDLGLLIVDEEQRFGVEHKEKIREIRTNVDTLTLSATPIPRTLQMSMMGLKDLSMIETPPMNRYPVQTYVVERHDALIKEAITRELARGGQVFYLFNRIRGIEGIVSRLSKLVPEARILYAHGKMHRESLESVLSDFIEHQADVLVSTTIIETGVDIPNTNTLIIHDADKLGLAQLYQIRGRVGRSDRIAYAYLLHDPGRPLNDDAAGRLDAIQDFTALGSGFKIAMRDLSIRGAGDLLGQEQSGFIDSVGIELYMKLLEEAITGQPLEGSKDLSPDDVFAPRHVDPSYVQKDEVRIEIHKRIGSLNTFVDVHDLKDELTDRFGPLDNDLMLYMYEKLFKKLSGRIGVQKTIRASKTVTLVLSLEASERVDGRKLFEVASGFGSPVRLNYLKGHVRIDLDIGSSEAHWLYVADRFLDAYFSRGSSGQGESAIS
jgi:transcription-repair coupling factor (superfamily II helicase)